MTEQRAQTVNYVQKCRDRHHHLITVTNAELLISHVGHRLHEGFQTGGRSTSEWHSQTPACSPSNSPMVGPYLVFKGQIVFLPLLGIKKKRWCRGRNSRVLAQVCRMFTLNSSWIFFLGGGWKGKSEKRQKGFSQSAFLALLGTQIVLDWNTFSFKTRFQDLFLWDLNGWGLMMSLWEEWESRGAGTKNGSSVV